MDASATLALREANYNATVDEIVQANSDLWIFRIRPDDSIPPFEAGQYISLGMGNWEPRLPNTQDEELPEGHRERICKRAYSISCSMRQGPERMLRVSDYNYLEFCITLVRHASPNPPGLTPRLFLLKPGDRLWIGRRATGKYTLEAVMPTSDVFLFATGTGEAPHNAMAAELLARGHQGKIVSLLCVRQKVDAPYRETHLELMRRYPNFQSILLTTREPENLDPAVHGYVGKRYLQDIVKSGELEDECGARIHPDTSHAFLCGNPDMIGIHAGAHPEPDPGSMVDVLLKRGFTLDAHHVHGNLHFERYW